MWLRPDPPPPEVVSGCQQRGLTLVASDCMPCLGSFIGTDDARITHLTRATLPSYSRIIDGIIALHHRSHTQQAALLLRYCAISQPVYLLRTLPPPITHSLCVAFDTCSHPARLLHTVRPSQTPSC